MFDERLADPKAPFGEGKVLFKDDNITHTSEIR